MWSETFLIIFGVILQIGKIFSNPSCPVLKSEMLNVHLVCHTHDDVGWLKTVDQYFYGANKTLSMAGVQYILDSVVQELKVNKERKFIYVESAFFFRWWNEQDGNMKKVVKELVESGQLEFINGGWSMNDEGSTHYNAIIDQMTLGLTLLNKTFGPVARPRVAWQIDPFGHSKEQASLFAQMGFDGLFFGRLDYEDKKSRWENKRMEIVWKGSNNIGESAWLFTGILPNGYDPPKGFCFDYFCGDNPIMDDSELEDYNVEERVTTFLKAVSEESEAYRTNNIIMTMGSDFQYMNANMWYKNLDKLIKYVNGRQVNGSKVNVIYSTPSCYLDALHALNLSWPDKTDDFFPYASDPHSFWTGYFTSRPTYKRLVRKANNALQALKQVSVLHPHSTTNSSFYFSAISLLSDAMGIAQHHDAVSGTAKQHVSDDYTKRLAEGLHAAEGVYSKTFGLMSGLDSLSATSYYFCSLLNESTCSFTENNQPPYRIIIYNPLARPVNHFVRLPIKLKTKLQIHDSKGDIISSQILPIPKRLMALPGRISSASHEQVFFASELPPLGFKIYTVKPVKHNSEGSVFKSKRRKFNPRDDTVVRNGNRWLVFDRNTKKLKVFGAADGDSFSQKELRQDWLWYAGMQGNNSKPEFRASGAYIFRPDGDPIEISKSKPKTTIYEGPIVTEIQQEFNPWVSQVIRMYNGTKYFEVDWLVGPIPIEDSKGKEIVTRYTWPKMETKNTFYTDANGRELQKRIKDFRPTWKLNQTEAVSENYYPVNSRILLRSTNAMGDTAVLTDRSQGGTSLSPGQVELMVHRRLLHDDDFGVGEALNETAFDKGIVVGGKHYILHSVTANKDCDFACQHRHMAQEVMLGPILAFTTASNQNYVRQKSSLEASLPPNVHLLTLEPWGEGKVLLRLEHMFEIGESDKYSQPVTVDLKNLFSEWTVTSYEEVTLSANQWGKESHRFSWKIEGDRRENFIQYPTTSKNPQQNPLTLQPMEIKSFVVVLEKK